MAAELVTMNFGLLCPTFLVQPSQTKLTPAARIRIIGRDLPFIAKVVQQKQVIVPRHVYGGEPVLVITALLDRMFLYALSDIVQTAEQDCCAMLWHSNDEGMLVGPHAGEWGGFNRDYFVM
jgi:hypothetical protein